MTKKAEISEIKNKIPEDVEEVYEGKVTAFGTGAKVGVPKKHLGKKTYIIVCKG